MRSRALTPFFAFIAVFTLCLAAWAGPEMPAKLAAQFGAYPGSTVVDATDSRMVVQAVLDCGSASAQEVYDFYKKQVAKGDWKHLVEREAKGKRHLLFSNPTLNGNIAVGSAGGKTTATISLMKSFTPRGSN
jgi:hypothetical protein